MDALVLVFARNTFYRRLYYFALLAFALSLAVIGVLCWVLYYLVKNPTQPLFFATDSVSRLVKIIPLSEPGRSTKDAMAWAIEAVQKSYAYDYVNYRAQLQSAQKYFTRYGWTEYMEALVASNNLLALTQRKQVILAQVIGEPKVIAEGLLGSAYAWKFQMPLLVTYWEPPFDAKSKFSNALLATITIQRQLELESYKGLGVVQLYTEFAQNPNQVREISGTSTG